MYRLIGQYKLGAHAQMILEQMADRSALLKLPQERRFRPLRPMRRRRMRFSMRRETMFSESYRTCRISWQCGRPLRFDNSAATLNLSSGWRLDRRGFRRARRGAEADHVSRWKRSARDGLRRKAKAEAEEVGFESRGEFGTQAAVVLMDMEQGAVFVRPLGEHDGRSRGRISIFRAAAASHYEVTITARAWLVSQHPWVPRIDCTAPRSGAILRLDAGSGLQPKAIRCPMWPALSNTGRS